jgi:serine/threonine protein kinase
MRLQAEFTCEFDGVATERSGAHVNDIFGDRFQVVRALRGASKEETLLATESVTGDAVVLKFVEPKKLTAGAKLRLEHEQSAFQNTSTEYLATLREIGRGDDRWICVRKFVRGQSLKYQLQERTLTVNETLAVGHCLLAAVRDLHDRGCLHGNINPSNLIVNADAAIVSATLVDSGLWNGESGDRALFVTRAGRIDRLRRCRDVRSVLGRSGSI